MPELLGRIRTLEKRMQAEGVNLSTDAYAPEMLDRF